MEALINEFYRCDIIQHGEFTLKSGEKSNFYIDCRKIFQYPNLMRMVCNEINKKIINSDWICGIPDGATPFASTVSLMRSIPLLMLRKEKKEYGMKRQIEGNYNVKDNVIVIEDVVTTGSSLNKYCDILENEGLNVLFKLCLINRGNVHTDSIHSLIPFNNLTQPDNYLLKCMKKNIIWAADVPSMKQLFEQLDIYGPKISVLKLHIDTFNDFSQENLLKLVDYKKKYNLILWEDRKFADIGNIMIKQIKNSIYYYLEWVDIFSIHCITGYESLNATMNEFSKLKWIIIGQLSSSENLIDKDYTNTCKEIYKTIPNIIGIVCQEYLGPEYIHIVPGISKHIESDSQGQQYSSTEDKSFADFFVVGRSISKFL